MIHWATMDKSRRSPSKVQQQVSSSSISATSKLPRPKISSTTSGIAPNPTLVPLRKRRFDHSCSRIVWCSNISACRADDFPDALKPVRSVSGAGGSRSNSKHLKKRRSSRLSTEHFLKHICRELKTAFDLFHVAGSTCNRIHEILVSHKPIERPSRCC